jgi:endonuclease/exonuclease/phosphatase family metal-dependent hydrolase
MRMDFRILNWNIGGARFLKESEPKRKDTRKQLNNELRWLIRRYNPDVVTLQEIVRYGKSKKDAEDIIDPVRSYRYFSFPLIDSDRLSSEAKWSAIKARGGWPRASFFAQGNAMLFRKDVPHFPVWDLSACGEKTWPGKRHFVEQVNMEYGLYFGHRSSEPRAALVAHFIYNPKPNKPLDIFVVNLHLTTLLMEREGIPEIDMEASKIRLAQLDLIFRGIVSRYNRWKHQDFPERGGPRKKEPHETYKRYEPVWILAGDFNFTPESVEYQTVQRMNFIDAVPNKGSGTKAKGAGKEATIVVDYIFAGPKFISLNPLIIEDEVSGNTVQHDAKGSDHYPMFAKIPLAVPGAIVRKSIEIRYVK